MLVSRRERAFLVLGLVVLAFNLRPAAVSVGPVLDEIRSGLGMGSTTAERSTTLPVLCFAGFGYVAPWCGRTFGMHRVMLGSLLVTAVGLVLRATAHSTVGVHRGDGPGAGRHGDRERAHPLAGQAALPGPDRLDDRRSTRRPWRSG